VVSRDDAVVFALCVDVDAEREDEFNEWYDKDHLPAVVACPGVISGRRFTAERIGRGAQDIATYWAFYEVESEAAMHSPQILALAEDGFGPFADCVSNVRRYWFRQLLPQFRQVPSGQVRELAHGE
jgi:hypothetical protein